MGPLTRDNKRIPADPDGSKRCGSETLFALGIKEWATSPAAEANRNIQMDEHSNLCIPHSPVLQVHSCQQKSIGLKFSKSQTGSDVRYSCHHNSSRFTFPIFAHSCRFSVLHSLQSITPRIY